MTFEAHAVPDGIPNGMPSSLYTRVWGLKSALWRTGYAGPCHIGLPVSQSPRLYRMLPPWDARTNPVR
jgi:hypothetical protein